MDRRDRERQGEGMEGNCLEERRFFRHAENTDELSAVTPVVTLRARSRRRAKGRRYALSSRDIRPPRPVFFPVRPRACVRVRKSAYAKQRAKCAKIEVRVTHAQETE